MSEHLLTPEELADRWKGKVDLGTLANWRSAGKGPKYIKPSSRAVFYRLEDVEAYEQTTARE